MDYNTEEIIISVGGKHVLFNALLSSLNPEDEGSENKLRSAPNISAEIISDLIQTNNNFFPGLEEKAEEILRQIQTSDSEYLFSDLKKYLSSFHNIRVATLPPEVKHNTVRFYDPVAKTVVISDRLPQSSITFLIAQQIGLISADD